jgi:thermitase
VFGNTKITTLAADSTASTSVTQDLYIDGVLKVSAQGTSLNYTWNSRRVRSGVHTILVRATDNIGNSTTKQVTVSKVSAK